MAQLHSGDSGSFNAHTRAMAPRANRRRAIGLMIGAGGAAVLLSVLLSPSQAMLRTPGAMNIGHESLVCEDCHRPAAGTTRQQLQANARYWLGLRETAVDFGNQAVENFDCLQCHERPFDRHPVFRFNEPRFAEARASLAPQECVSCHREHSGVRVTAQPGYCVECHSDIELFNDPLDVPHKRLAQQQRWSTCLGCHDFHGNHIMDTKTRISDMIPRRAISEYFAGGRSPYPRRLRVSAQKERQDVAEK